MIINKLVLLRHGESQWNLENRFTGWTDVDLTKNGWGIFEDLIIIVGVLASLIYFYFSFLFIRIYRIINCIVIDFQLDTSFKIRYIIINMSDTLSHDLSSLVKISPFEDVSMTLLETRYN